MTKVAMQLDPEVSIIPHYVALRNLLKSEQEMAAERYFLANSLVNNWQTLFQYTMSRRNCPVTRLILKMVYLMQVRQFQKMTGKEFGIEVSRLFHDFRQNHFKNNLDLKSKEYIHSEEYLKNLNGYLEVQSEIRSGLERFTGAPIYSVVQTVTKNDQEQVAVGHN